MNWKNLQTIVVLDMDREAGKINCYIRRVPKIKQLEEMEEEAAPLLGRASSANGNRTRILALRGLRPNR